MLGAIGRYDREIGGFQRLSQLAAAALLSTTSFSGRCSAVGTTIRVDLRLGIPQLDISVEGRTVRAVLDSGAQLSYADREMATRHSPVGVVEDFYPVLGRFETRVYRFAVTVQGREIDAQWGILPDRLRHLLPLAGARWILGVAFFKDRRIVLDFARGRVVDCR